MIDDHWEVHKYSPEMPTSGLPQNQYIRKDINGYFIQFICKPLLLNFNVLRSVIVGYLCSVCVDFVVSLVSIYSSYVLDDDETSELIKLL